LADEYRPIDLASIDPTNCLTSVGNDAYYPFAFCGSALALFLQQRGKRLQLSLAYKELPQAAGSRADAGNGTLKLVAESIDPPYGTVRSFPTAGATGTRWLALLARERGTAPCVAEPEGKRHA